MEGADSQALQPELSDAELIEQIGSGAVASQAEAELCGRYRRRIWLYGLKHTRDTEAAADLVQDVLEMLIQKARAGQLHEPDRFGSFVLGSCRLLLQNLQRKTARRGRILAQYLDPREATTAERDDAADLERARHCLAGLSERERGVLLLSYYAELDAAAIAREFGLSSANVRVIRHRAIERMQVCVHAQGPRRGQTA